MECSKEREMRRKKTEVSIGNGKIQIDKDVPIPPTMTKTNSNPASSILNALSVGDSFSLESNEIAKTRKLVTYYGKKTGRKFTMRRIDDDHHRIWRIK